MPIIEDHKGNRYRFRFDDRSKLGEGAMGAVYLGKDSQGQDVAIKQLHPKYVRNLAVVERARLEASLEIVHPNVIRMLGYSEVVDDDGQPYVFIISEYVHGTPIRTFVDSLPEEMRRDTVIDMMGRLLDGLACLHHHQIIHRDIKPANILVENGRNIRIMDLGIARTSVNNSFSVDGIMIGTPLYAPPEQVRGQREQMDATSDLYSAGVTGYELLTGVNPFTGDTEYDVLSKQINSVLPPHPALSRALLKVLRKATEKDKEKRYRSAEAFKEAFLAASQTQQRQVPISLLAVVVLGIVFLILLSMLIIRTF